MARASLLYLIESGDGNRRLKLIVQTTPNDTGLIGGLLQNVGAIVTTLQSNLNIRVVEVVENSANVIAADPNVRYVSLDAPVRSPLLGDGFAIGDCSTGDPGTGMR